VLSAGVLERSADEAYRLIADRARILFPGSCGALCMIASSRDLVEVMSTWGESALAERFFAPKDCWGLRRGRVHVMGDPSDPLACTHLGLVRPRWAVCVPMMAHGEALGLLCLLASLPLCPSARATHPTMC
jgi:hypothetical protein